MGKTKPGCGGIFMGLVAGACIGGAVCMAYSMLNGMGEDDVTPVLNDPPAPNLERHMPETAKVIYEITRDIYDTVPEENKKQFRKLIRRCIRESESLAIIKTKVMDGDTEDDHRDVVQRGIIAVNNACEAVANAIKLMSGHGIELMNRQADVLGELLQAQLIDMKRDVGTMNK